jgi:hypothetical protein
MGKNLNISVLVAARDEYIDQLKCILVPLLIQGFNSIYQDAINISNNNLSVLNQELSKRQQAGVADAEPVYSQQQPQ